MNNTILVNFSKFPFCFRNVYLKNKFTNMLSNENEFFDKFRCLLEELLPHVCSRTFEELISEKFHCHIVRNTEEEKIKLIYDVVSELVSQWRPEIDTELFLKQNLDGEKLWQLGNRGIRLIGIRNDNIFNVLFIDYHHLIYPNQKYNDTDYASYNFKVIN